MPTGVVIETRGLFDANTLRGYCREAGIDLLVLFGSHAAGTAGAESDVDLAVQLRRGVPMDKLQLIFDLEEIFAPRSVDLVFLNPLTPPLLLHEIFIKGMPLLEGSPGEFRKGRLRAWKLYQDAAPLRERERRALEGFIKRIRHVA